MAPTTQFQTRRSFLGHILCSSRIYRSGGVLEDRCRARTVALALFRCLTFWMQLLLLQRCAESCAWPNRRPWFRIFPPTFRGCAGTAPSSTSNQVQLLRPVRLQGGLMTYAVERAIALVDLGQQFKPVARNSNIMQILIDRFSRTMQDEELQTKCLKMVCVESTRSVASYWMNHTGW